MAFIDANGVRLGSVHFAATSFIGKHDGGCQEKAPCRLIQRDDGHFLPEKEIAVIILLRADHDFVTSRETASPL